MRRNVEEWLAKNNFSIKVILRRGKDFHGIDELHIKAAIDYLYDNERLSTRKARIAWRIWEIAQSKELEKNVQVWIDNYEAERAKLKNYDNMAYKVQTVEQLWKRRLVLVASGVYAIFGVFVVFLTLYVRG